MRLYAGWSSFIAIAIQIVNLTLSGAAVFRHNEDYKTSLVFILFFFMTPWERFCKGALLLRVKFKVNSECSLSFLCYFKLQLLLILRKVADADLLRTAANERRMRR